MFRQFVTIMTLALSLPSLAMKGGDKSIINATNITYTAVPQQPKRTVPKQHIRFNSESTRSDGNGILTTEDTTFGKKKMPEQYKIEEIANNLIKTLENEGPKTFKEDLLQQPHISSVLMAIESLLKQGQYKEAWITEACVSALCERLAQFTVTNIVKRGLATSKNLAQFRKYLVLIRDMNVLFTETLTNSTDDTLTEDILELAKLFEEMQDMSVIAANINVSIKQVKELREYLKWLYSAHKKTASLNTSTDHKMLIYIKNMVLLCTQQADKDRMTYLFYDHLKSFSGKLQQQINEKLDEQVEDYDNIWDCRQQKIELQKISARWKKTCHEKIVEANKRLKEEIDIDEDDEPASNGNCFSIYWQRFKRRF